MLLPCLVPCNKMAILGREVLVQYTTQHRVRPAAHAPPYINHILDLNAFAEFLYLITSKNFNPIGF